MNYKTQGEVYKQDNLTIINDDCMNILKQTPDNYYDLCLVDPPYGIGMSGGKIGGDKCGISKNYKNFAGDDLKTPDEDYFKASVERIRKETRQLELF